MAENKTFSNEMDSFETIFAQILAAEKQAIEAGEKAEEKRLAALENIGRKTEDLKQQYTQQAEKEIKAFEEKQKARAEDEIAESDRCYLQKSEKLSAVDDQKCAELATELFNRVIKD